ncbi:putative sodium/calcium exchanger protein [Elsinoe australis]|uniref:Putative sodium/calcium exchanger protein n=1 Tax=Elsinoe australis TaxID=40998 RepID=A0A4U7B8N9_9PEZI|nr:putative sodium/calcium exchanger protein [Elsinoe australis]
MAADMLDQIRVRRSGARKQKERRFSVRAFYLTCLIFTVFALVSFWPERRFGTLSPNNNAGLYGRDLESLSSSVSDEECRLVHKKRVTDKCAFIKKHCPDEEPGFLAYLHFYYCSLASVKPIAFILLVCWMGLLFSTIGIAASDFFCINLSTISTLLGMSESLAGVTFLAFGNGSPDVFSTFAAMSTNSSSLAIGELFGAAGFITAVVAGSMALVRPFKVAKKSFIRDVGFFAVAAAFSMGFLSDGNLHLWECAAMVIYYVFYVCVVVLWHWYITRRVRRRERDAAARGHFITPGSEELDIQEEYRDDPDEQTRPSFSRGVSAEDFRALEDGGIPRIEEPEEDESMRDRWLGEIQNNMRLRPSRGRSSTITPVRPSLVGALEFQSVLKSLNKSRNIQTIPMHARRYSDEPVYTLAQQDHMSTVSAPAEETPSDPGTGLLTPQTGRPVLSAGSGRTRAVSANDAASLQIDPKFFQKHARQPPPLLEIHEDEDGRLMPPSPTSTNATRTARSPLPGAATPSDRSISPATPATRPRRVTPDLLAPPEDSPPAPRVQSRLADEGRYLDSPEQSPRSRPRLPALRIPSGTKTPRGSNPPSPFPAYNDTLSSPSTRAPSLYLPPASVSVESQPFFPDDEQDIEEAKPPRWWPSSVLPSPTVLASTLIPTLYHWRGKSWWELILSVIAAPSVLLLTVTLPVVDSERDEDEDDEPQEPHGTRISVTNYDDNAPPKHISPEVQVQPPLEDGPSSPIVTPGTAGVAAKVEHKHHHNGPAQTPPANPTTIDVPTGPNPKAWNRWLTITQLYLSPIMIVLIIYTQYLPPTKHQNFGSVVVRPLLIALLVSTILLIPLLLTTTPNHRPKAYLPLLSLAGFVVSIAWISTIASQVVAILKAFAIILNMSHAILGLTVFAVGNSLGDLVADITVARLGYPVMALSACFGGPMLNILLGIGLSGCWILFRGAEKRHKKHPDREWKSGTYEIEVGDTLIVSGVTLLITLVGLLVAVPLNGWIMSRRIAWVLIALWCTGTVVNVVIEVVGLGGNEKGA